MRFFLDTEFRDAGNMVELVSVGIAAEDGRTYYAISSEFDVEALKADSWLFKNVWSSIKDDVENGNTKPREQIARELSEFTAPSHAIRAKMTGALPLVKEQAEFWAVCGAYDWTLVLQLFGGLMKRPKHWPPYFNELYQFRNQVGVQIPKIHSGTAHVALDDATNLKADWEYLTAIQYRMGTQ